MQNPSFISETLKNVTIVGEGVIIFENVAHKDELDLVIPKTSCFSVLLLKRCNSLIWLHF